MTALHRVLGGGAGGLLLTTVRCVSLPGAQPVKVAEPLTDELNSVGLSLVHTPAGYRVGGLVRRNGTVALRGIAVGHQLMAVKGEWQRR